ncbi:hypothetical protein ACFLIM_41590 [Nonomuraea sp. M3C6]|uniref:HMA domain-containing protein n=1 Tax=Nonomuraea marmarensis TaxID=3351344 RepID=A0ABW7ARL8_9ACTN
MSGARPEEEGMRKSAVREEIVLSSAGYTVKGMTCGHCVSSVKEGRP